MSNRQEAERQMREFEQSNNQLNQQIEQQLANSQTQQLVALQNQLERTRELRSQLNILQPQFLRLQPGPERTQVGYEIIGIYAELGDREGVEMISQALGRPQARPQIPQREQVRSPEVSTPIIQNVEVQDTLLRDSHEALIKQLYGIPVELPEYLIVNGLRVSFVPFQQIVEMLQNNQVERFTLDPMVQPWVGPPTSPNRILTMFGRNGITYLVKARYDQNTTQIFPPI